MASKKEEIRRTGWREAGGILLLALSVLALLSQISYQPGDIGILQFPPHAPTANFVGPVGAWGTFLTFLVFGVTGYLFPPIIAALGLVLVLSREVRVRYKLLWVMLVLVALACLVEMQTELWAGAVRRLNIGNPGGLLGAVLAETVLVRFLGGIGAGIVCTALLVAGLVLLFEIRPLQVARQFSGASRALYRKANAAMDAYRDRQEQLAREEREIAKQRRRLEKSVQMQTAPRPQKKALARTVDDTASAPVEAAETRPARAAIPTPAHSVTPAPAAAAPVSAEILDVAAHDAGTGPEVYRLPPLDLLRDADATPLDDRDSADLATSAAVLEETLLDFGIECKVTNVEQGPVVSRYEVLPAAGVRVERIAGLSNNIALALKAVSVRVQAPIPGKGVVGIEVPNSQSSIVNLRELMESEVWRAGDQALPLALGKDVAGRVIVSDLADMPHVLIAGATGSGKTVCMNSLLAGLLMSRTPAEMRLMLIDPKIVEFGPYNGLPHLVVPVITDPKKVGLGLRWAINEMEKRYKTFAKSGVRNIKDFNERPRETELDLPGLDAPDSPEDAIPDTLPYIVIIVDELADLMLAAQAEIENSIARLAQLSRAVGIHMVIATQRPSVNVITGTIKANFPARIAFQVAQKVDSRTILDTIGADKLLGKGDMLFLPPGSSKVVRAQGSFTADEDIRQIVEFIREQGSPEYILEVHERIEGKVVDVPAVDHTDELLESAVEIIRQTRRASTSSLQRRLRIGYTRAARLMDMLEERGIIGPPQGSDPREILIDLDGEIPQNQVVE